MLPIDHIYLLLFELEHGTEKRIFRHDILVGCRFPSHSIHEGSSGTYLPVKEH